MVKKAWVTVAVFVRIHTTLESVESNSYQFRIPVGGQSGECVAKIEPTDNPKLKWANYVLGTVNEFLKHQSLTSGFDCRNLLLLSAFLTLQI